MRNWWISSAEYHTQRDKHILQYLELNMGSNIYLANSLGLMHALFQSMWDQKLFHKNCYVLFDDKESWWY